MVKVITTKNPFQDESQWQRDITELKEDVYYLDDRYPFWLSVNPATFKEKLLYRASLIYVKALDNGNYFDKSILWRKKLLEKTNEIVRRFGINNLICTVAPFRSSYYLLEIKKLFNQLNYIVDYRDPWTNNQTAYGFQTISNKRLLLEIEMERQVLHNADYITSVSQEMFPYFFKIAGDIIKPKCVEIKNGFDSEDIELKSNRFDFLSNENNNIRIAFTGTLYNKTESIFKKFVDALVNFNQNNDKQIILHLAGDIPDFGLKLVDNKNVFYWGKLSLADSYSLISNSHFGALFLTNDLNYSFSTKFYEYLAFRKPVLVASENEGKTAEFITENNIGISFNKNNLLEQFKRVIELSNTGMMNYALMDELLNKNSINYQTEKLDEILK
ncbi:MAG: hypothetical protein N3F09_03770 [Bacteroidia bacterium]|nr:hypothetical protein [Bacteroidia bacterium]